MRTGVVSEQGHRSSMEDRHVLLTGFMEDRHVLLTGFMDRKRVFGGVYDGHRGSFAAEYASRHLHERFQEALQQDPNPRQAFVTAYESIAAELSREPSGTTAVTFFLDGTSLTTANCGDARAVLIKKDKTLQLTVDHRLDNTEERDRIEQVGSRVLYPYVMSGSQGLMPTRTLGDAGFYEAGIIPEPFVDTYTIEPEDRFILAGCDGLFDVLDNEQVGEFGYWAQTPEELVQSLSEEVLEKRMGMDNLTIVVCAVSG